MGDLNVEALLAGRRKRWLCLVWVLGLSAVFVLPGVDHSIQQFQTLGKLRAELVSRAELPDRARQLSESVARRKDEVSHLEDLLVTAGRLPAFKQTITRLVRAKNCHLRSIRPGSVTRRPLNDMLGKTAVSAGKAPKADAWEVEEQLSMISVEGSFADLMRFISVLNDEPQLLELASLDLHPLPNNPKRIILDLNIKTFDLLRNS